MKIAKIIAAALAVAVLLGLSACSRSAIKSAADLDGKKVGVREGATGETWVRANLPNANVSSYRTIADAAVDLNRGLLDAIVIGEMNARELVAEYNSLQILTNAPSFFREEYGIAVRKGNVELLNAVNAAIEKARASGEYNILYSSFITPDGGNITIPSFNIPAGSRTLRVGTNSGFPPFGYMEGGKVVGFDVSMAQLIGREYDANIEIVDMPFANLIPSVATGDIDLIAAAMTITESRKESVDFSIPYFTTEQVIVIKK